MKKTYLPTREPARVLWLNNFAAKFANYAAAFGFTPAEVDLVNKMAVLYSFIINLIESVSNFKKELTAYKNLLSISKTVLPMGDVPELASLTAPPLTPAGIFTLISGYVQRIKGNSLVYTESIGEEMGIIGEETTFDQDTFKPEIKGNSMPGSNVIKFTKHGVDGVNVYSHEVGGDPNVWVLLAFDGHSPYHDTRPAAVAGKPETRQYKVRGVLHDVEIGLWSDVITITFVE